MNRLLLLPLLVAFVAGCQKPIPERGEWLGTVTLAEQRKLPFRMVLDLHLPPSGYFLVNSERTPVPEIQVSGDSLSIIISEYGAAMKGRWDGERWSGKFIRYRKDTVSLDFSASPVSGVPATGAKESPPGVRLVGMFQAYFQAPKGIDSTTVAKFWTKGDSVFGTFIDPSGDHGLMTGIQTGNKAWLGRFIGWQANLVELELKDGSWSGRYYARQFPPQLFALLPRPALPKQPLDPKRTRMKDPWAPFVFEGITPEGDTVRNSDPSFKGKALIVDIMGTWCHNCLDEAPLLRQLYSEFKEKGLQVVGLSFEITNDAAVGRKNLDIYRRRHDISFPLLYAGSLDPPVVDAKINSQLVDFFAYPTTIFIDRTGKVRHIHWGFKGPGTGDEYQQEVELAYRAVRELLSH